MVATPQMDPAGDNGSHSTVMVGQTPITMQQLQQIYTELTGKPESISKFYTDPILPDLVYLENLHHCIIQTWEQYSIVSSSFLFTVYYVKNTKDQFNSFDRMKLQVPAGTEPVESVIIKYDFLVILPSVSKPQSYTITIRLVSRLSLERRMKEDHSFFVLPRIIRLMGQGTASVEINYVDYTVARAFLTAIDDWYRSVPQSPKNRLMKTLQKYSHLIPRFSPMITVIISTFLILNTIPHFIIPESLNLTEFTKFFAYAGLGIYVSAMLALWSALFAERAIDQWQELSYIDFNRGDKTQLASSNHENRYQLLKSGIGIFGVVLVDIAAKIIADFAIAYL